jgi:magnesium chelatase family protein
VQAEELIKKIVIAESMSARGYHKLLKVSRTIADMENEEMIQDKHVAEAASYRILLDSVP